MLGDVHSPAQQLVFCWTAFTQLLTAQKGTCEHNLVPFCLKLMFSTGQRIQRYNKQGAVVSAKVYYSGNQRESGVYYRDGGGGGT